MNYINILLLIFYICVAIKYYKKLKETDESLKENELDYSEIKLQLKIFEKILNELDDEIIKIKQDLHNEK